MFIVSKALLISSAREVVRAGVHMYGIMLLLRAVLNVLVKNANQRGSMCFRRLMVSLSGPVELDFCFVSCGECNVISLYFLCSLLLNLFVLCVACLTVFVNCLVKQCAIFGGGCYLLLNVIKGLSVS